MSFLEKFDTDYRDLLQKRAEGFRVMFELLEYMEASHYRILETGSLRLLDNWAGDGQSTRLFDAFVNFHNGVVFSVDIDPAVIAVARSTVSSRTHCICSDSVRFLNDFTAMTGGCCGFDLIYLDSFDLDVNNPGPSAFHHMKELMAVGRLKPGTIVAVDDNLVIDGHSIGKGYLVEAYFANIDVPLIYNGYQKVWRMP